MKIKELVSQWQSSAGEQRAPNAYEVRLPLYDAAKIEALTQMFPGLSAERVITDLLASALDELNQSFAYEPSDQISGHDEHGDPMYADAGLTPRFQALTRQNVEKMKNDTSDA
ncbi:MAG: type 1 pili tip component [Xanthomonadales bacterium]|nr:type 1 pili tip component [Xanthomonadales bacterium]|tara:strand:- start:34 stop:372 length:339 start_codon:yes stop_codon:yes gene_type:complete